VRGGAIPVNPATHRYLDECLQQETLLNHADARIRPLALVDLEKLELTEAICQQETSWPTILEGWQSSAVPSDGHYAATSY
jgi:hypothetical protein